jgi:hypothetical protein
LQFPSASLRRHPQSELRGFSSNNYAALSGVKRFYGPFLVGRACRESTTGPSALFTHSTI